MELLEYWYMLLRRKWVVGGAVALVVGLVGGYVFMAPPQYEADAKLLLVDEGSSGLLGELAVNDMMLQTLGKADPITTQVEILKTRPIMERVIALLDLKSPRGEPITTEALRAGLSFEVMRNTNIISIRYRHHDPDVATRVVNTLAAVFVESNQRLNQDEIRSAKLFVEHQLERQKQLLAQAEQAVVAFKRSSQSVLLAEETRARVNALVALETAQLELETALEGAKAQQADLQKKLARSDAAQQPYYPYWLSTLEQTQNQMTNTVAQKNKVMAQISHISGAMNGLPPKEIELARLMRDESIANQIYTRLLAQHEEFKIQEAAKVANIKIIEPAVQPREAVAPNKKKLLALGLVAGLMLGLGLALLLEYLDDSPGSLDELKRELGFHLLGGIPSFVKESQLFMRTHPSSFVAEALKMVQINLKFKGVFGRPSTALMLSSALPGEGKSTLSVNLALGLALSGKRVVVVNLDLRRPTFYKIFGQTFSPGVSDYLIGEATLEQILHVNVDSGVDVIGAGTIPPNPGELLASARLAGLIEALRSRYEVLLFDTPPMTLVAESLDVASQMDGIVLVVNASTTPLRVIGQLRDMLIDKHLPICGFIANRIDKFAGASYGRYGKYAAYASEERGERGGHGGVV